jgi:hypothetical protein
MPERNGGAPKPAKRSIPFSGFAHYNFSGFAFYTTSNKKNSQEYSFFDIILSNGEKR